MAVDIAHSYNKQFDSMGTTVPPPTTLYTIHAARKHIDSDTSVLGDKESEIPKILRGFLD
jgi:hypothetical protein